MAQRRMFSLKIVDTDAFIDMPPSSQLLYFHLAMRADDDGFVSNPKKIMRFIGCSESDYNELIEKRFVLTFSSGICVIKHWLIHNYIQKDRYMPTKYTDEKKLIKTKENGAYTECIQDVSESETQVRLGKVRIGKNNTLSAAKAADAQPSKEKKETKPKKEKAEVVTFTPEILEEKLCEMEKNENSHLNIIATYIREKPVKIENSKQLSNIIVRFAKAASDIAGAYSMDQVFAAIDAIKKDNGWRARKGEEEIDWGVETVLKKLVKK